MERIAFMGKACHSIKAGDIQKAMSDLGKFSVNNGFEDEIRADFGQGIAFCLGLACGIHEERQRRKGGDKA